MESENGKEFALPSGAKLYVSVAEWGKVKPLHDAVARALIGSGVSAPEVAAVVKTVRDRLAPGGDDAKASKEEQVTLLAVLARKALEVASNQELERAIFACAEAAYYRPDGTDKLSVQFSFKALGYGVFDHPACRLSARGDYYDICEAVVEVNLLPFATALLSKFLGHMGRSADTPESSSGGSPTPS